MGQALARGIHTHEMWVLVLQAERALFLQRAVIADANAAQQLSALTPVQPPQLSALTPHSALVRSSYNKQQVATASCCLLSLG